MRKLSETTINILCATKDTTTTYYLDWHGNIQTFIVVRASKSDMVPKVKSCPVNWTLI